MKHRMKQNLTRLFALLLSLCLLVSGLPVQGRAASTEIGNECVGLDTATMKFKKGQVLEKNEDFTVTAKDIRVAYKSYIFIDLTVENTSKQALQFMASSCEIDGYYVSTYITQEILPGSKADISFHFDPVALASVGMDHVENLSISIQVSEKGTAKVLYNNCTLKIGLGADIHLDYNPREKVVYQEDGFTLTLMGSAFLEKRSAPTMVFLLENRLNGPLVVRNYGNILMNDKVESLLVLAETAPANSDLLFVITPFENFEDIFPGGGVAYYDFYLRICTGLWNPLVDSKLYLGLTRSGTIQTNSIAAVKSSGYETGMKEYTLASNPVLGAKEKANMFVGAFSNYVPHPEYISSMRNKYPKSDARYGSGSIFPYVNELLMLYLADLDDAGFNYGIVERLDLCTEDSYVVELTENGKSAIQIAVTMKEYDPKAAHMITLGCMTDNYKDLDVLNRHLEAMWMMYDLLNVDMTPEKHQSLIPNSESTTKDGYVILRGAIDGLGYVYGTSSTDCYLTITPDLTLSMFYGMGEKNPKQRLNANLKVGDTFFFGTYEQDNNTANGTEDIEWVILAKKEDKVLVTSVNALDSQRFHNTAGDNIAWRNSSVRSWLNDDFYFYAFTKEEKAKINAQRIETMTGKDKVFLLSQREAELYFSTAAARLCKPTVYAANHGAYVNSGTRGSWWLLRTNASAKGKIVSVNSDGTIDYDGGKVESPNGTVRPAMWISTAK